MIKAIETHWKGYRFRSRLEARWAVFFERLGIPWQYEPEGFHTSHGRYLPDFFLPTVSSGLWVEIKPVIFHDDINIEIAKLCSVVSGTYHQATLFMGDPFDVCMNEPSERPGADSWSANVLITETGDGAGACDCPYCFCICPKCGRIGFEFDGRGNRVCGDACAARPVRDGFIYGSVTHPCKGYSYNHPRILNAAREARSARFEHGEVPA